MRSRPYTKSPLAAERQLVLMVAMVRAAVERTGIVVRETGDVVRIEVGVWQEEIEDIRRWVEELGAERCIPWIEILCGLVGGKE